MYIKDGIVYAGDTAPAIRVSGVKPIDGHKLWVRFNTGEAKIFDFSPLFAFPAFAPLTNRAVFDSVYIDYGVTVWNEGEIDIAPSELYDKGIPV